MLFVGFKKMRKFLDNANNYKQEEMNRWIIGVSILSALFNLILAALTFFLFTIPAYNGYLELYDSVSTSDEQPIMSCWIKYDGSAVNSDLL